MRKLLSIILFCILLPLCTMAFADPERILNFDSTIVVNKDASMDVTENISVYANRDKIIDGIIRQLPTYFRDSYGRTHSKHYTIERILLNKSIAPYHFLASRNQLAIFIGEKNIPLNPGIYHYTLQYHVEHAVNFLTDADELYWNITGNDWDLPIRQASANVILPEEAAIKHYTGYTGFKGDTQQDLNITQNASNRITFVTTEPLLPNQSLTIAVSWQKGIMTRSGIMDTWLYDFIAYQSQMILGVLVVISFIYYFSIWYLNSRNRYAGIITPYFTPPAHLSPASMRYLFHMGYDLKTLTAAIISIAIKGGLVIHNENDEFTLVNTGKDQDLSGDETTLKKAFFKDKDTINLTSNHWKTISTVQTQQKNTLGNKLKTIYFVTNRKYLMLGWCIVLLAFVIALFSIDDVGSAFPSLFIFLLLVIFGYAATVKCLKKIKQAKVSRTFKNISKAFFSLIIVGIVLAFAISMILFTPDIQMLNLLTMLCLLVILNLIFSQLLKTPTVDGHKIMHQIDGFKLFLSGTKQQLDQFNPPEKTPELFAKYLPYAIALDVESAWGKQFNFILKKQPYHPAWYTGTYWNASTPADFLFLLSKKLTEAVSIPTASRVRSL